ncbi:helix-turn-helix domain-containing protein [Anaerococcus lactolyticus]|nr:helix-turn-helix domain-containing protein [Anaerococcus lactolyticus]
MSKNSYVNLESLEKICLALDYDISDIMECIKND